MRLRWLLLGVLFLVLAGCQSDKIGPSQINQSFPEQSEEQVEATLARENPQALQEYKESKARDAARDAETRGMIQGQEGK